MEVDAASTSAAADGAGAGNAIDGAMEELVTRYGELLEALASSPYSRELHDEHVELTRQLGQGFDEAMGMLNDYFPLSTTEWLEWLKVKQERVEAMPKPTTEVDAWLELMQLHQRSVQDFVSIPLLCSYSQFVIGGYYRAEGISLPTATTGGEDGEEDDDTAASEQRQTGDRDEVLAEVFTLEIVRNICQEVLQIGGLHLAESSKLWTIWRDFEVDLLRLTKSADQLVQVEELWTERLKVPHIDLDETFDAYSPFVTKYDNMSYDSVMPAASKIKGQTSRKVDEREPKETELANAGFTDEAYKNYVDWELEVRNPDVPLVKMLFERAVANNRQSVMLWEAYIDFYNAKQKGDQGVMQVAERAVRTLPASAELWCAYLRLAERHEQEQTFVEELFGRALSTQAFDKDIDALMELYTTRASYYRRQADTMLEQSGDVDANVVDAVCQVLIQGIDKVNAAQKFGDDHVRLEKYLTRVYERFGKFDEAAGVWSKLVKKKSRSAAAWYGKADFETRVGRVKDAHQTYTAAIGQFLDYPEAILDAWVTFENQNGTLADLEYTLAKAARVQKGIDKRRAREAANAGPPPAAADAAEPAQAAQASTSAAAEASTSTADASKKREREAEDGPAPAKKVKVEEPQEQKRDRENSTVFVNGLPSAVSDDDLRHFFRECGDIREIKIRPFGEHSVATVEFMDKDSVLAARTRDKKKVKESEVDVYIAWQATIYTTNFPESFDKEHLEEHFKPYGTIFETRWPSKRFKNTRRFCYVQFLRPESAQAALELNGRELEGQKMAVYISDPTRKKQRTDANANDKELYVSNLARSTKEADLQKVFSSVGAVKGVRLITDDKGDSKGFAFVEYEDEVTAKAALSLNNTEIKKRRIAVTIAEHRDRGAVKQNKGEGSRLERRAEQQSRRVRITGLKAGTEEAIVQQEVAKRATVHQVLMEQGATEATVEFENAAEAGKILLSVETEPLVIDEVTVKVMPDGRRVGGGARAKVLPAASANAVAPDGGASAAKPSEAPLMPRAMRGGARGRPGLGARGGRRGGTAASAAPKQAASTSGPTASSSGQSQDDFRALLAGGGAKKEEGTE